MNLISQYNVVFDADGKIKNCGRRECIRLMEMLSEKEPNIDFGNTKTGFMNIKNISEECFL
jgi:hypothetical protein